MFISKHQHCNGEKNSLEDTRIFDPCEYKVIYKYDHFYVLQFCCTLPNREELADCVDNPYLLVIMASSKYSNKIKNPKLREKIFYKNVFRSLILVSIAICEIIFLIYLLISMQARAHGTLFPLWPGPTCFSISLSTRLFLSPKSRRGAGRSAGHFLGFLFLFHFFVPA